MRHDGKNNRIPLQQLHSNKNIFLCVRTNILDSCYLGLSISLFEHRLLAHSSNVRIGSNIHLASLKSSAIERLTLNLATTYLPQSTPKSLTPNRKMTDAIFTQQNAWTNPKGRICTSPTCPFILLQNAGKISNSSDPYASCYPFENIWAALYRLRAGVAIGGDESLVESFCPVHGGQSSG